MSTTNKIQLINRITPWLLGFYFIAILLLFLAELGVPILQDYFRATNQVLILLVLLILPVVIMGMSRFIHSLTVKISGQELHLELSELRNDVKAEVTKVESNLGGQISNAEQALWPILAGKNFACAARLQQRHIVIGSKLDPSHLFFGHLLSQCIEKFVDNSRCEIRFPNGGSMKNLADIQNHWIDLYIDSSGTCCQYFNIDHRGKTDLVIQRELNQYGEALGLTWLDPLGASEDYCLVMAPQTAAKFEIESIRDLKLTGSLLTFAGDPEFLNRNDCFLGLKRYGIEFNSVKPCRILDRYEFLRSGEAEVFVGYETDPQLIAGDVIRLTDPDQFFPRYLAVPLVSTLALEKIPELKDALAKLHNCITTDELIIAVNKLCKHNNDPDIAQGLAIDVIKRI